MAARSIALDYPVRALVSQGEQQIPLLHLAHLKEVRDFEEVRGQRIQLEFPAEAYQDGRDWTAYLVTFDPARPSEQFLEATEFVVRRFQEGRLDVDLACLGPAFSLMLSPIKNLYLEAMLSRGAATLKQVTNVSTSRHLFRNLAQVLKELPPASSADLASPIGRELVAELGLDLSPDPDPQSLIRRLLGLKQGLANFDLAGFSLNQVQQGLPRVAANALSGLGLSLPSLQLALGLFSALNEFAHRHEFQFYNLEVAETGNDGLVRLHIPEADRDQIRLDENRDGSQGKDLRHVLCYHYRGTTRQPQSLQVVDGSLALSDQRAGNTATLEVLGDTFTFGPSLSLQNYVRFSTWQVQGQDLKVQLLDGGRLQLSGFEALFGQQNALECRLLCRGSFEGLLSGTLRFLRT